MHGRPDYVIEAQRACRIFAFNYLESITMITATQYRRIKLGSIGQGDMARAVETRETIIARNRTRSAMLRERLLARPDEKLVAYAMLRTHGSTARDALALVRACSVHHLMSWSASGENAHDAARASAIRTAAKKLVGYLADQLDEDPNPRDAFRLLYGVERQQPVYVALTR